MVLSCQGDALKFPFDDLICVSQFECCKSIPKKCNLLKILLVLHFYFNITIDIIGIVLGRVFLGGVGGGNYRL